MYTENISDNISEMVLDRDVVTTGH